MTASDFITYVITQVLGAIAGAAILYLVMSGKASGWDGGLGQNGWGPGYLGGFNLTSAFLYEVIGTFLFLVCILGVTQRGAPVDLAGLAIGLTLIAIHLWGLNHRHLAQSRPLAWAGTDRCRDEAGGARPSVALHRCAVDRRGHRRLLVQARRRARGGRRDSFPRPRHPHRANATRGRAG